jgi:ABC-type sugar transport system ATPase subunit
MPSVSLLNFETKFMKTKNWQQFGEPKAVYTKLETRKIAKMLNRSSLYFCIIQIKERKAN